MTVALCTHWKVSSLNAVQTDNAVQTVYLFIGRYIFILVVTVANAVAWKVSSLNNLSSALSQQVIGHTLIHIEVLETTCLQCV